MKLENLKHDLPETPDFIHQMVVSEVERQVNKETAVIIRPKQRKHWSFGKTAAVAACAVFAASTIAYAGVSLYHIYSEKNGEYGVTTSIELEANQDYSLPAEVSEVEIQANYIPEGMEWLDSKLGYPDYKGGFSFIKLLLDQPDPDINTDIEDTNVVETETRTFGKYEGTYIRMNDLEATDSITYNQRFYLLCPEEYRVLVVYVSNNISKEEAYKVIENLELVETGEMIETAEAYSCWSNYVNPETYQSESEMVTSLSEDSLAVHEIGEAVDVEMFAEDADGEFVDTTDITATVDQVQVADDLSLLEEERIPEEWKAAVGSDGKLVQNELSYIKSGDGVDTIDEIVRSEMENQKLVAVDITYTNTGDVDLQNVLYNASTTTIAQDAGTYTIYDYGAQPGDDYDYVSGKSVAAKYYMEYSDAFEVYGNGDNYISSLAAGESVTVRVAWIVNERDLSDLYLDLSSFGEGIAFTEHTCLVDIRQ
jgi:hypothetical protein